MKMLEYLMANNGNTSNTSESGLKVALEDPSSTILFVGYPPWLLYLAAGCCVLFMLIGIPGNLITVAALFRTKKLRNATAVFIMNLSVSDLMFCCFNLPLATSTFWQSSWMHGPLLCRLFPLLRYGLVAVSLFTVLAITINRYVMIGHPRLYPKVYKPKYLVLMVLATWISGFGALIATWFEQWGRFGLDPSIGSCSILPDDRGRSPKEFLFILAFLAPCIAIIVCYARIFYIVRKTALKSRRREKVTSDLVKASIEIKYTKSLEDSAIGSSCGATLTTTENGGSPTKCNSKHNFVSSGSLHTVNHRDLSTTLSRNAAKALLPVSEALANARTTGSEGRTEEGLSQGTESMLEVQTDSEANESSSVRIDEALVDNADELSSTSHLDLCSIDKLRAPESAIAGEGDRCSELSVEFIPFIDTCCEQRITDDVEAAPSSENPGNAALRSLSNSPFFEPHSGTSKPAELADGAIEGGEDRGRYCLRVPTRFSHCSDKICGKFSPNDSQGSQHSSNLLQILDTRSLKNDEGNGPSATKSCSKPPHRINNDKLLNPGSLRPSRHHSDLSDEHGSSRSDSPAERDESTRKMSLFRRESRFRSVRNRTLETGKMSPKDKKLLKMILVIFSSFLICYLPITITKTFKNVVDWWGLNIASYILIYLTTCINPIIYVVMSSEYRSAYKNVLLCRSES
ncbi:probable G-protein coupled receptor 101 [Venturia canescens]|uniref:probable G-protein coupled receptor 101 n=1 Tax=Venturia canescens TaxID=32260 RepID=UPI001C9D1CB3|nr:probable G-protein coupled receptor 101 [Venturia canescens]XP_043284444.1 probable G-protein coupled receptor 101 [Venturia canescens]XP_043284445.1 probable G-protein coupled receptor 101 [Venturia canescens]XP_043284446.1 probable G-protein coupled receptor 101 [Venturia canescens]